MRPTLAAARLRSRLTQYLATTCPLTARKPGGRWRGVWSMPRPGCSAVPFCGSGVPSITPRPAGEKHWERVPGFAPYRHQTKAYERLSTLHGLSLATLVTAGTGSGKTASFLVPAFDRCRTVRGFWVHEFAARKGRATAPCWWTQRATGGGLAKPGPHRPNLIIYDRSWCIIDHFDPRRHIHSSSVRYCTGSRWPQAYAVR